jgi:nicotinate phosphoribosyltransferase
VPVALLTDHYELTMLAGAVADGLADRPAVFEVFCRRLPPGRRFAVAAGQGRLAALLEDLVWDDAAKSVAERFLDAATLSWLDGRRPAPQISSYAEGDVFVPGSPVLTVEGTFGEGLLLETLTLSVLNHDSAVASAAARMVLAAGGRPLIEMGSRRTHEQAAVAAARAAWLAGFAGTSNLQAGRAYGIPTLGTSAHAFVLAHPSEREAFASQVASQGQGTTLLVDTYDVLQGVRTAIEVAGPALRAVRLDSGDLADQARQVRLLLDSLGASHTRIVATSDLDEHRIAALADDPVDEYGVGTALVTGSGAPTANLVYKLVAIAGEDGTMRPVAKRSAGKRTLGGRKWAYRDSTGEVLLSRPAERPGLQVPLVDDLPAARTRCAAALAALPAEARALSPGQPAWTAVLP